MRYNCLFVLFIALILSNDVSSQLAKESKANSRYFHMPSMSDGDYMPKTVIFRLKEQYRSTCSKDNIENVPLSNFLTEIGAIGLSKKFPNHFAPARAYDKFAQRYEDLSLIYSFKYTAELPLEKVINKLYSLGLIEYAQPKYLPKTTAFTPNDPNIGLQYSITKMKVDSAWGINTTTARGDTNVVIGVTDTGIDFTHPDLGNIKYNYDDPINGSDDDNDGYIDNYRGWDLAMGDNNPTWQGTDHGVHVTGISSAKTNNSIGVSGVGFNCKYLPVKIGNEIGILTAAYEGVVYAADQGCDIINCSWGSPYGGQFEQDVINYATINKNCLVIAAAGNNAKEEEFFPSSCKYVLRVLSMDSNDKKAFLSNFGYSVDVCAGGEQVYSTLGGGSYGNLSGTSMASPNVAGAAAIVKSYFPSYTALQIGERLKVTTDNIYSLNPGYAFKLGTGRINLYRALAGPALPSVIMTQRTETDNNDDSFVIGDTVRIRGVFTNYLASTTNLTATLSVINGASYVSVLDGSTTLGVINTLGISSNNSDPFLVKVQSTAPLNTTIVFKLTLTDGAYTATQIFSLIVNVDYINIAINDVATTITSKGLIGYNKDEQLEGLGFTYKSSGTLLYESSLMIGTSSTNVSDMSRGVSVTPDADFQSVVRVKKNPAFYSDYDVAGTFDDTPAGSSKLNVLINHSAYAWTAPGFTKFVMVKYIIKNKGSTPLNNLYVGILADWDIDENTYDSNKAAFDFANKLGYVYHSATNGLYAGIKLLSNSAPVVHYAIDNSTGGSGGVNMSDGFDATEKYTVLSSNRTTAGDTGVGGDVINVISTGPFTINNGDSVSVGFAILAGDSLSDLQLSAQNAQLKWDSLPVTEIKELVGNQDLFLYQNFPNPFSEKTTLAFNLRKTEIVQLKLFNVMGQEISTLCNEELASGTHSFTIDAIKLSSGIYYYQLQAGTKTITKKMLVNK